MIEKGSKTAYEPYYENSAAGGVSFRLPLSGISTHKSINPSILKIITSAGTFNYDGSVAVNIDISDSIVSQASALSGNPTISLSGGAITNTGTVFNGADNITIQVNKLDAGYISLGTLAVERGGTGKTSWTAGGLVYASANTTLSQVAVGNAGQLLQQTNNGPQWVSTSTLEVGSATVADALTGGNVSLGCGFGRCTTGESSTGKTVTMLNYTASEGGVVAILFDNNVPSGSTLNINGTGAKSI